VSDITIPQHPIRAIMLTWRDVSPISLVVNEMGVGRGVQAKSAGNSE
jgi:hypothetical protein